MRIATIIGARPQFVKAAVVSREISKRSGISESIIHTGQHFDHNMSEVFFTEMDIPKPNYQLQIHSLSHGAMTGRMLEELEKLYGEILPDAVLVYGDTNSTLAGALAASKLQIPVFHVEAGLRSFNMAMPEEINRILTDRISNLLFCPTDQAVKNLLNEGFKNHQYARIVKSGDVMEDAALYYADKYDENSRLFDSYNLSKGDFALCTIHRQENTDDPDKLLEIISALNELNKRIKIVLPIHPRTKQRIDLLDVRFEGLLLEPVGYLDMIQLIQNSTLVLTDSGGLQKEAFFFSKYCITMREETEWVELVDSGYNQLAGNSKSRIIKAFDMVYNKAYPQKNDLYGGGNAATLICNEIEKV